MIQALANPQRFMDFSRWAAPAFGALAAVLLLSGLSLAFMVPEDYQQGDTIRFLFIHPQAAITGMAVYVCLAVSSFFGLVFRHSLADAAARAAAPLGAGFTFIALVTGMFWGRPMWGAWWVWGDARLTSVLVLFLLYVGYMVLHAAIEDEAKADRAAGILAMVGIVNLPIIKFSVDWWNTLHQPASIIRAEGPAIAGVYIAPFSLMNFGFLALFGALWLVRIRGEIYRKRARALALQKAGRR